MQTSRLIEPLNLSTIELGLKTKVIGRPVIGENELHDEIDSTNSRAIQLASQGAGEGLIILARAQTAGRGRLGRTWYSALGAGIYMSILLRPKNRMPSLSLSTIAAGLAVANAVHLVAGIKLGLKWVNDLVFANRKVGGILAEMQNQQSNEPIKAIRDQTQQALIIGIGINICSNNVQLPDELIGKVHWLEDIAGHAIDRNLLVSQIANELEQIFDLLYAGKTTPILDGWRKYSATLGEHIQANLGNKTIEGLALDITDSGALIVQTSTGKQDLCAGEISIRKSDGSY
jgi:BirA family biotin operon repressor/biotin-[acetyl-CoA-carboxylase] ligase